MSETNTMEFRIPEANLHDLKFRVAKLSKKAEKLCGVPVVLTVLRTETVPGKTPGSVKLFHIVTVSGPQPKYEGWELVASLQHMQTEEGEMTIVRSVPGKEVPVEYRNSSSLVCDHCQTARNRKDTFVVKHDDGTFKKVGRQCIADFLGHKDPAALVAMFEALATIGEASEFEGSGGGTENRWALSHFLGFVAAVIRVDGWLSRTKARQNDMQASADMAFDIMIKVSLGQTRYVKPEYIPTEADYIRGEAAMAYMDTFLETHKEDNDYLHNLDVVMAVGNVEWKTAGLAGSLLPTAEREMGKEVERSKALMLKETSRHFGTVGQKLFVKATVLSGFETEGIYGATTIIRFITAEGNAATWFASGSRSAEYKPGMEVILAATVKKHDSYKGMQTTILTRCNTVTEEIVKAETLKAEKKAARLAKKAQQATA
jgi:hypothetical protein